jgi:putative heme degradation protein
MANIYTNAFFNLNTTNLTTVYTCPSDSRSILQNIQYTNESGTTQVQVYITDNSASTTYEINHNSLSANETYNAALGPVILEESDVLKIKANAVDVISGTVSILEINRSDQNG